MAAWRGRAIERAVGDTAASKALRAMEDHAPMRARASEGPGVVFDLTGSSQHAAQRRHLKSQSTVIESAGSLSKWPPRDQARGPDSADSLSSESRAHRELAAARDSGERGPEDVATALIEGRATGAKSVSWRAQ